MTVKSVYLTLQNGHKTKLDFGFGLFLECHLSANLLILAQCCISIPFSGGREMEHWAKMGSYSHCFRNCGSDNATGIT